MFAYGSGQQRYTRVFPLPISALLPKRLIRGVLSCRLEDHTMMNKRILAIVVAIVIVIGALAGIVTGVMDVPSGVASAVAGSAAGAFAGIIGKNQHQ